MHMCITTSFSYYMVVTVLCVYKWITESEKGIATNSHMHQAAIVIESTRFWADSESPSIENKMASSKLARQTKQQWTMDCRSGNGVLLNMLAESMFSSQCSVSKRLIGNIGESEEHKTWCIYMHAELVCS